MFEPFDSLKYSEVDILVKQILLKLSLSGAKHYSKYPQITRTSIQASLNPDFL